MSVNSETVLDGPSMPEVAAAQERKAIKEARELKSELRTALSALRDLRELTKASTHHTSEAGAPDFVLFKLPKDGALRSRGMLILDRVDKIFSKTETKEEGEVA